MRLVVAGPIRARKGQKARLTAKLRKGMHHAFCEVFSSAGWVAPSPHVPLRKLGMLKDGRPVMTGGTTMRLTDIRPEVTIELEVDEDCDFYIMQDVDVSSDPRVKARIRTNGGIWGAVAQAFRRLVGNR